MSSKQRTQNNVTSSHATSDPESDDSEETKKVKASPQSSGAGAGSAAANGKTEDKEKEQSNSSVSSPSSSTASSSTSGSGSGNMEVRALIDNSAVGGIIGKGGANVKHVREEAGIFVSILKSEYKAPKERVLLLKGPASSIAKGVRMICDLIAEANQNEEKKKSSGENAESVVFRILVHRSAVGAVIGKAGATIKQTQSETNTRIQVSNEPLPGSTEKTISISGSPAAIQSAVTRVLSQLRDNPIRSGAKVVPYVPGMPVYPNTPFGYGAYPSFQQQPLLFGSQNPSTYNAVMAASLHQTTRQELTIPSSCAGAVIGKGGAVIRDIRTQTGTSISISPPNDETPNERVVTITGPAHGVNMAIFSIRQLAEQAQSSNSSSSSASSSSAASSSTSS